MMPFLPGEVPGRNPSGHYSLGSSPILRIPPLQLSTACPQELCLRHAPAETMFAGLPQKL